MPNVKDMSRQRYYGKDFSGQDLSKAKMRQSLFRSCNFDRANLSEADCEGSEFFGSTFRETLCYRTNFRDAKLAGTVFAPKDAFGITVTLHCKTFEDMEVPQLWFLAWLLFASMMRPEMHPIKEDLRGKVIAVIGADRYTRLCQLFQKREI